MNQPELTINCELPGSGTIKCQAGKWSAWLPSNVVYSNMDSLDKLAQAVTDGEWSRFMLHVRKFVLAVDLATCGDKPDTPYTYDIMGWKIMSDGVKWRITNLPDDLVSDGVIEGKDLEALLEHLKELAFDYNPVSKFSLLMAETRKMFEYWRSQKEQSND